MEKKFMRVFIITFVIGIIILTAFFMYIWVKY